ncbi:MAG: gamma carbonic anhydrase family protein [Thioalkalispiraceae bacterium]|jgi:carbonic anhydrase/acetyltransferase-like protein (isoleucine patch superfamily)
MIREFNNMTPRLGEGVYIDEQSAVIGDVVIGDDSSVWPFTSIRGDVNKIRIGRRTNIQDNSTIHVTHASDQQPGGVPAIIGDDVTVGHQVILHACTIGDRCLIGMGSIIMDRAVIAANTIIGAGSLVTQDKQLEGGYLYVGRPAKRLRALNDEEKDYLTYSSAHYVRLKEQYLPK